MLVQVGTCTYYYALRQRLNSTSTLSSQTGFVNGHEDLPYCPRSDQTCKDTTNGTDAYGENWDYDGHGHGTHCSGTIGAIGNNEKGVVGVFDSSSHWSLQVGKALSKSGSGSSVGVMAAVENCVLAGAKVVSMSLGCDECYQQSGDGELLVFFVAPLPHEYCTNFDITLVMLTIRLLY